MADKKSARGQLCLFDGDSHFDFPPSHTLPPIDQQLPAGKEIKAFLLVCFLSIGRVYYLYRICYDKENGRDKRIGML